MKILIYHTGDGLRQPRYCAEGFVRGLANLLQTPEVP